MSMDFRRIKAEIDRPSHDDDDCRVVGDLHLPCPLCIHCGCNASQMPTPQPTASPLPTAAPVPLPTAVPVPVPTAVPVPLPTAVPVPLPTAVPVPLPTVVPTVSPVPTPQPFPLPTRVPLPMPTTSECTWAPTFSASSCSLSGGVCYATENYCNGIFHSEGCGASSCGCCVEVGRLVRHAYYRRVSSHRSHRSCRVPLYFAERTTGSD